MQQPLRLRPKDVPLQWDEAAAIVQVIADHVADGRLAEVPLVEWLALDDEGALHVLLPPNPEAEQHHGGPPAAALRELFQQLVGSNPVPAALLTAVGAADGATNAGSAEAFNEAIRYFVRPGQDKAFRLVTARLRQYEEESRLQSGLDELLRKARATDSPRDGLPPESPAVIRKPRRKILIATLVGVVTLSLLVMLSIWLRGADGLKSPASALLKQGQELLKEGRASARTLLGDAPADPAAAPTPAAPPRDVRGPRNHEPVRTGAAPVLRSEALSGVASISWILEHRVDALPDTADELLIAAAAEGALYDADDVEVTPASLLRPRLPSQPRTGTPLAELGLLEVIIGANGKVERVRLLATTAERRYYDAMLLPAVKAWIFTPAYRNGVPVRYRLELPLTN